MDSFLVLTGSKHTMQVLASPADVETSGLGSAASEVLVSTSVDTPAALNAPVNQHISDIQCCVDGAQCATNIWCILDFCRVKVCNLNCPRIHTFWIGEVGINCAVFIPLIGFQER